MWVEIGSSSKMNTDNLRAVHQEIHQVVDCTDPEQSLDDLCVWKGTWKRGTQRDICLSLWGGNCTEDCGRDNFHCNGVRFHNYRFK